MIVYRFTGWGDQGTRIDQDRGGEFGFNPLAFVAVARDHLLDGEQLVRVVRTGDGRRCEWVFTGGGEFARCAE